MKKIIVVSDTHLGYEKSNASTFLSFLEYLSGRNDIGTLVILGDFIDMWRRDVSGLFLEYRAAVDKLIQLKNTAEINVVFVAGNHDYHLLKLVGDTYQFNFNINLSLSAAVAADDTTTSNIITYKFKHGYEYDLAQRALVMEALCWNLSNDTGRDRTEVYNFLMKIKDRIEDLLSFHRGPQGYVDHLLQPPEVRLSPYMTDVEKRAFADVALAGKNEILIFGHTHRPFVSSDGRVVNSGSWVSDAVIQNTFVELEGRQARLFQFGSADKITEITDRRDPPSS